MLFRVEWRLATRTININENNDINVETFSVIWVHVRGSLSSSANLRKTQRQQRRHHRHHLPIAGARSADHASTMLIVWSFTRKWERRTMMTQHQSRRVISCTCFSVLSMGFLCCSHIWGQNYGIVRKQINVRDWTLLSAEHIYERYPFMHLSIVIRF